MSLFFIEPCGWPHLLFTTFSQKGNGPQTGHVGKKGGGGAEHSPKQSKIQQRYRRPVSLKGEKVLLELKYGNSFHASTCFLIWCLFLQFSFLELWLQGKEKEITKQNVGELIIREKFSYIYWKATVHIKHSLNINLKKWISDRYFYIKKSTHSSHYWHKPLKPSLSNVTI